MGDAQLRLMLAGVGRRDRVEFRRLYDSTAPKLFALLLRITRNRTLAEDVLQETFVKVWQSADRYSSDAGSPMAWLGTIARNRAIDRLRSERFDRLEAPADNERDVFDTIAADPGIDPGDRESVRRCLSELDDEPRRCIVLAYCSGYSREELAARFDRPVGTIKTMLHRSIRSLRSCMERA